jgi:hypothetical protein
MGRPSATRPLQKYQQFAGNPGSIHETLQHRRTSDNTDGAVLMLAEIQELLDRYAAWLKDNTSLRQLGNEWVEITTSYLDPNNDHLQIYARQDNGSFVLTDDSKTLHELEMAGCDLNSPKRKDLLQVTLKGFGVNLKGHALEVYASPENFAARKHRLIQAMLAVSDMFYLAQPMVKSLFYEDVVAWLDESGVRYTERPKFAGISGYDHLFDFVIPKSRTQPERLLKAITTPKRDTAESLIQAWTDTKGARPPDSRAYAFLNDAGRQTAVKSVQAIPAGVTEALRNYEIRPVVWSKRNQVRQELAA